MSELAERAGDGVSRYRARVLVVEREARVRAALSHCLQTLDCTVVVTDTVEAALDAAEHRSFDLAFVDPSIEIEVGRDLGSRLLDESPGMTLVLVTSCTTFGTSLSERLRSSCEHVPAAFTPGQIKRIVERFCEQRLLRLRLAEAEREVRALGNGDELIAESPAMRATLASAALVASSGGVVVLLGEPGSGRQTVARLIHRSSPHAAGAFVAANLFGSEESIASELFGCGRSKRNGSGGGHPGLVEQAEDGTLFLEEVESLPTSLEAPLLRLLQHNDFERVGELRVRQATARMIVSSREGFASLSTLAGRESRFKVAGIRVPPLRDRQADIVPLARMFLERFARGMRRGRLSFTDAAERLLATYAWPGNIPELRNTVERAVIMGRGPTLDTSELPDYVSWSSEEIPRLGGDFSLDQIEREHIRRVASRTDSDVAATKVLGISRSTLWRKRNS